MKSTLYILSVVSKVCLDEATFLVYKCFKEVYRKGIAEPKSLNVANRIRNSDNVRRTSDKSA